MRGAGADLRPTRALMNLTFRLGLLIAFVLSCLIVLGAGARQDADRQPGTSQSALRDRR